jgi:hypothetical protein
MEERRLGAWDCRYCNTKKILGNIYECPGCGHPRHKGVRFYQIPYGPIVTEEIQKQLGSGGPNWYCEHCGCGNRDTDTKCMDCGAPKGSSPTHEVKVYQGRNSGPKSTEEAEELDPDGESWVSEKEPSKFYADPVDEYIPEEESREHYSSYDSNSYSSVPPRKEPFEWKKYGLIALAVILFFSLGFLGHQIFFNTHEETVAIAGYSWEQKVVLEEYTAVRESNWSSHPPEAYDIDVDYRDTGRDRKVHDGWRTVTYMDTCSRSVYVSRTCSETVDNGDGSFSTRTYECGSNQTEYYSCQKTRQEEVYHYEDIWDNYYTYTIDKWVFVEEYPTSGTDHTPVFAQVEVSNTYLSGTPTLGQQQANEIPGKYKIQFKSENNKIGEDGYFERDYPLEEWLLFSEEKEYTITVNIFNHILEKPEP